MKNYNNYRYKRDDVEEDVIVVFDSETIPKENLNEEYLKQRKYHLEKYQSYKYSLMNEEEKDYYAKVTSHVLSQVVAICGKVYFPNNLKEPKQEFRIVDKNDEKNVISNFITNIVNHFDGLNVLWVHYNGLGFDCPLILRKAALHNIEVKNKSFKYLPKFQSFPHYDVCALLGNWGNEVISLENACIEFGIESPKTGITNYSNIATSDEKDIGDYCMKDVEAVYDLFTKVRNKVN